MGNCCELILHIYNLTLMGKKNTKKIMKLIVEKDNKIKGIVEEIYKEYDGFNKECKMLMKEKKIKCEHDSTLATITANMAMMSEISNDNSDSKVADILLRGLKMGEIEIQKCLSDYNGKVDKKAAAFTNKVLKFHKYYDKILTSYL